MPTHNVNLTDQQSELIQRLMEEGRYKNASEIVRAGLRLLESYEEEQRMKLERLRAEVQKGMDDLENGRYVDITGPEQRAAFFAELTAEVKAKYAKEHTSSREASSK